MRLEIHVDRLVLDAELLSAEQAPNLAAALQRELGGLLSVGSGPDRLRRLERSAGGALDLGMAAEGGDALGAQLARALVGLDSSAAGRPSPEGPRR